MLVALARRACSSSTGAGARPATLARALCAAEKPPLAVDWGAIDSRSHGRAAAPADDAAAPGAAGGGGGGGGAGGKPAGGQTSLARVLEAGAEGADTRTAQFLLQQDHDAVHDLAEGFRRQALGRNVPSSNSAARIDERRVRMVQRAGALLDPVEFAPPRARRTARRLVPECVFCQTDEQLDWTNASLLNTFLSERGRILPRRDTWLCRKHQRRMARAVKTARQMAFLPFVSKLPEPAPTQDREMLRLQAEALSARRVGRGRS